MALAVAWLGTCYKQHWTELAWLPGCLVLRTERAYTAAAEGCGGMALLSAHLRACTCAPSSSRAPYPQPHPPTHPSCSAPRVLVCAQSNAAVDELVARIATKGLIGRCGRGRGRACACAWVVASDPARPPLSLREPWASSRCSRCLCLLAAASAYRGQPGWACLQRRSPQASLKCCIPCAAAAGTLPVPAGNWV